MLPALRPLLALVMILSAAPLRAGGEDWMARFPDAAPLSALPIPGTHNSGALHEPVRSSAACQALTIPAQLAAGVRFLDIRCRHVKNDFAIHHGIVFQNLMFADVVRDVLAFLDRHPAETVLISIQQNSGAEDNIRSFPATVDAFIAKNPGRWLTGSAIPRLGDARGKIVLFRRYGDSDRGIDATAWQSQRAPNLRVQDDFRVADNDAKWRAIVAMFAATQAGPADTFFLNFTSGYRSNLLGLPDIRVVSDFINPRLAAWLKDNPKNRRGIVVMDFVTPELCDLVIGPAAAATPRP